MQGESVVIVDQEGLRVAAELLEEDETHRLVRLENGRKVSIPTDALVKRSEGDYYLLLTLRELEDHSEDETVIPILEERLRVTKRLVPRSTVRVTKRVVEHQEIVDEPLLREEVEVERVAINRRVDEAPGVRHDGDTLVVPIVEEVMVIEKRLVLKEELHIKKRQVERREPQSVTLRREEAEVERSEASATADEKTNR